MRGDARLLGLAGSLEAGAALHRPAALGLHASAVLIGGYRWVEQRLFEVVGRWVADELLPDARVFFDVQSQQHAWHAELFEARLPVLDGVDLDLLTVVPSAGVGRLFETLGTGVPDTAAPEVSALLRLVGLGRVVLPRLVAGYTLHLRRCNPTADASAMRAVRLVRRDAFEAWQTAELMVQILATTPDALAAATERQHSLEMLVAEGPGLVPWPASSSGMDHHPPA